MVVLLLAEFEDGFLGLVRRGKRVEVGLQRECVSTLSKRGDLMTHNVVTRLVGVQVVAAGKVAVEEVDKVLGSTHEPDETRDVVLKNSQL